jgi:predicted enzyme related to lactoylglutathione lyase
MSRLAQSWINRQALIRSLAEQQGIVILKLELNQTVHAMEWCANSSLQGVPMVNNIKPGSVIFTGDHKRLAKFYEAVTGLTVTFTDDGITVLGSDSFELVIHSLPQEPKVSEPPQVRRDCYIKPFFSVRSLADAREKAAALGGELRPANEEWMARGFRACEAIDPDGNVIQFREVEVSTTTT